MIDKKTNFQLFAFSILFYLVYMYFVYFYSFNLFMLLMLYNNQLIFNVFSLYLFEL